MANRTKSANLAPLAARLNAAPVWPAGGIPSSDCGLTDIDDSPQENRRLTGSVVCRTSAPVGQISSQRPGRRWHLRPETADFAARVVFHLGRRTEYHGGAGLGIVA